MKKLIILLILLLGGCGTAHNPRYRHQPRPQLELEKTPVNKKL